MYMLKKIYFLIKSAHQSLSRMCLAIILWRLVETNITSDSGSAELINPVYIQSCLLIVVNGSGSTITYLTDLFKMSCSFRQDFGDTVNKKMTPESDSGGLVKHA